MFLFPENEGVGGVGVAACSGAEGSGFEWGRWVGKGIRCGSRKVSRGGGVGKEEVGVFEKGGDFWVSLKACDGDG